MDYLSTPKLKKTQTQISYLYRQKNFYQVPQICNHYLGGICYKLVNNNNYNYNYKTDFFCNKCQFTTCSFCYSNKCQLCYQKNIEALNLFVGKND